jgi:hypothetical protein
MLCQRPAHDVQALLDHPPGSTSTGNPWPWETLPAGRRVCCANTTSMQFAAHPTGFRMASRARTAYAGIGERNKAQAGLSNVWQKPPGPKLGSPARCPGCRTPMLMALTPDHLALLRSRHALHVGGGRGSAQLHAESTTVIDGLWRSTGRGDRQ